MLAGQNLLEYGYSIFSTIVPNDGEFYTIRNPGWMVLRVQGAIRANQGANGSIAMAGATMPIEPGGCLLLEPGGLFRGDIIVQMNESGVASDGFRVTIEFAWRATQDAVAPPTTMS